MAAQFYESYITVHNLYISLITASEYRELNEYSSEMFKG